MVRDDEGGSGQWPEFSVDVEVLAQFRAKMARVADEWDRVVTEAGVGLPHLSADDFGWAFQTVAGWYDFRSPMLETSVRKYGELLRR